MVRALTILVSVLLFFVSLLSLPRQVSADIWVTDEGRLEPFFNTSTCLVKVDSTECYKLRWPQNWDWWYGFDQSIEFEWLKRATTLNISDITNNLWKTVYTYGPLKINTNGNNSYQLVKTVTPSPLGGPVVLGVGGGDAEQGNPDFHTELGVKTIGPGVIWAYAQPTKLNRVYAQPGTTFWNTLDANMQHCKNLGAQCPIYIGGVPGWAVAGAIAKTGLVCDDNNNHIVDEKDNTFGYPLDETAYQDFADFVAAVAERYDADGINDAPSGAKASFLNIFNEPDYGAPILRRPDGTFKASCEDPLYWTTTTDQAVKNPPPDPEPQGYVKQYINDLNGNSKVDAQDFAELFWKIYTTVNPTVDVNGKRTINMLTNYGRLATVYSNKTTPLSASGKFLVNILSYKFGPGGLNTGYEKPYSVMDIHYYDEFFNDFYDATYNIGGIRAKILSVNEYMKANDGETKPIVFTEFGKGAQDDAAEEIQAQRLIKMVAEAYSTNLVKQMSWWLLKSSSTDTFHRGNALVLFTYNPSTQTYTYDRRPAFTAMKTLIEELGNGDWRFSDLNFTHDCGERYIFRNPAGDYKEVVWAQNRKPAGATPPCGSTISPKYDASQIVIRKKDGTTITIDDGETGATPDLDLTVNGQVKISVGADPVIVKY